MCQIGCAQCADGSGTCTQCQQGFSLNPSDQTKCNPTQQSTSTGTVCPDGSFSNGNSCQSCDSSCQTCNGGTSNECTLCASGRYTLNGACVSADSNGICTGSNLIANNNKHECDSTARSLFLLTLSLTFVRLSREMYVLQNTQFQHRIDGEPTAMYRMFARVLPL